MKIAFRTLSIFVLILAAVFCLPAPCSANPIPMVGYYTSDIPPVYLWLLSPLVEVLVILLVLWRSFSNRQALVRPALLIYLLNFITLPATQYLAIWLFNYVHHTAIYAAELLPLAVESVFLKLIFNSLYKRGSLKAPVSLKRTILIALLANTVTFILGVLFYHYFPTTYSRLKLEPANYIPPPPGQ
jgi:hypothetical protein